MLMLAATPTAPMPPAAATAVPRLLSLSSQASGVMPWAGWKVEPQSSPTAVTLCNPSAAAARRRTTPNAPRTLLSTSNLVACRSWIPSCPRCTPLLPVIDDARWTKFTVGGRSPGKRAHCQYRFFTQPLLSSPLRPPTSAQGDAISRLCHYTSTGPHVLTSCRVWLEQDAEDYAGGHGRTTPR
jgi:hypothetical protein